MSQMKTNKSFMNTSVTGKNSPKKGKDSKEDGKLSQSKDEIHKVSRDTRNYSRQVKESTVSQKGKDVREYITPAIRIREPKTTNENNLLNKQKEEEELRKSTNGKSGDLITDPIPEEQCVSQSIEISLSDHKVVEEENPNA